MELQRLEQIKKELEEEFGKLQKRVADLETEWNALRVEQTRYQGEYRLLKRLLEECQSERAGLPPFNPSPGETQAGEDISMGYDHE